MVTGLLRKSSGLLTLLILFAAIVPASAQDLHPSRRLSPIGIAKTHLGDTYVKVTYGRPYLRERNIFGADSTFLVPYGQLWRTGANEATEITATGPLLVAGQRLDAGTYAIFTEPGPNEWVVHFSPQLGLDGTGRLDEATDAFTPDVYDSSNDVLAVTVPSSSLQEDVDQFTISFEEAAGSSNMVFRWERTEVRIPIAPATN